MQLFNVPNILTGFNFLCGVASVILSLSGRLDICIYPIFAALVFDYLDGFSARLLHQKSPMGKELDSLADLVSFGLAPGIWMFMILPSVLVKETVTSNINLIVYYFLQWFMAVIDGRSFNYLPFIALLIPFLSLFRLAKFNIDTRQSMSFIGLPTPANTLFFMIFPILLFVSRDGAIAFSLRNFFFHPVILIGCCVIFSILLVAEIPLFSLKFSSYKFQDNIVRYTFLIVAVLVLIFLRFLGIPIIIVLYLVFSIIENKFVKKSTYEV